MKPVRWTAIFLAAGCSLFPVVAGATSVSVNGTTIMSDDFEGGTPGSPPVAQVGAWSPNDFFSRPIGTVSNAASPGPAQGSQYLSAAPPLGNNASASVDLTLNPGDQLRWQSEVYIPSASFAIDYPWQLVLIAAGQGSVSNRLLSVQPFAGGASWGSDKVGGGYFNYAGPTSYAGDKWQLWTLDYTVGAASATLTIDGVSASLATSTTSPAVGGNAFTISLFTNYADPAVGFYLDGVAPVPEPATGVLACLGAMLGVIAFGRRSGKQ